LDGQQPGWYEAEKESIEPAVLARNEAQKLYTRDPTTTNHKKLQEKRKKVKTITHTAQQSWYEHVMSAINYDTGFNEGGLPKSAAQAWSGIKKIRAGKSVTKGAHK
jgi:hypothetical protein